jgi:hypothetical protein
MLARIDDVERDGVDGDKSAGRHSAELVVGDRKLLADANGWSRTISKKTSWIGVPPVTTGLGTLLLK